MEGSALISLASGVASGALSKRNVSVFGVAGGSYPSGYLDFSAKKVIPTAEKFQPRAWGSLACVYLGLPS